MTVKVLGPLDTGTAPLSPRERAILSALVVRHGESIGTAELASAFWGDAPPRTWPQQVKTSIGRIRSKLGREAVLTRGSEYALGIDPDAIDAVRFERLVSSARRHALHGEPDRAIDNYRRALALWRGAAYPDLTGWEPGIIEAMRLTDIRAGAEEELLEQRLQTGDAKGVLPVAEQLLREQPLREDRWAIVALADYRLGRQADALATLRAARSRLRDELGVEPGARLRVLEQQILRQDPSLDAIEAAPASDECPYPGLRAFGPDDAEEFFGRDHDIDAVLDRLTPASVVAISGASGCGKSSLLLAGVLPRVAAGGRRAALVTPGTTTTMLERILGDGTTEIIAIDQAEELFARDSIEVERACALLAAWRDGGGCLILTLRSDFLDRAAALPWIGPAIGQGTFVLGPLSESALREAIEKPAARAGLRIEPGLVEVVLRDAGDRVSTLPHVSHALFATWLRREGNTLSVDAYEAAGGIRGSIAQSAEDVYRSLDPGSRDICRGLMLRLVGAEAGGAMVRRRAAGEPLMAEPRRRAVLERLIAARLVVIDGPSAIVAHEALATAWPRLAGWLEERAEAGRQFSVVSAGAHTWESGGRSDDDLLRGGRLETALEWRAVEAPDLTASEADFLSRSEERRQSEIFLLTERAREDRRQNRRLRGALGGAAALLVIALVSGGVAAVQAASASQAAVEAQIEAVTSSATSLRTSNRDVAALMAAEAYRRWPDDPRTKSALLSALVSAGGYLGSIEIPDAKLRVGAWPVPDSRKVMVVRDYVHVEEYDRLTGNRERTFDSPLRLPPQTVRPWVRVSADGSTLVVVQHLGDDTPTRPEQVTFFDMASGRPVGPSVVVDSLAETVALSPDGRFATWATDGLLVVVDRDTRSTQTSRIAATEQTTTAVSAFADDGTLVASTVGGDILTFDPATLTLLTTRRLSTGNITRGLSVLHDGGLFGIGTDSAIAVSPSGEVLWEHRYLRPGECTRSAASAQMDVAVCGDEAGRIEQWRLSTGDLATADFEYQFGATGDLAFVDDGRELLLLGAVRPVIGRLRVDGSGPISRAIATGRVTQAYAPQGLSPSGQQVLVERRGDTALPATTEVWDISKDAASFRIPEDVTTSFEGQLGDPRWLTEDRLVVFRYFAPDPAAGQDSTAAPDDFEALTLDLPTGELSRSEVPVDIAEVYPSADPGHVYLSTLDGRVRRFDTTKMSWDGPAIQLPAAPNVITDSEDGSRIVAITWEDGQTIPLSTHLIDARTGEILRSTRNEDFAAQMTTSGEVILGGLYRIGAYRARDLLPERSLPNLSINDVFSASSDESLLLARAGGTRGVATLLDPATGRIVGQPFPMDPTGRGWINPDGSALILPTARGLAEWTLEPGALFTAACALAGRELTDAEWKTFLPQLSGPEKTCSAAESSGARPPR